MSEEENDIIPDASVDITTEFLASARQILADVARIQSKYTGKNVRLPQFAVSCQHYAFVVDAFMDSFEQGEQNALYFSEEVMPSIDRKKNIRVRDRATMTNLILGLHGYTVASSAISRELNGPDIVAVPLAYDDEVRIGLLSRADMSLSRPGTAFADALRARVAQLV